MSKVLVDRELLERCVDRWACCAIVETPGAEQAWLELRAAVKEAQPAEAEGVEHWSGLRLAAEVAEEDGPWEPRLGMTNVEAAFAQSASPTRVLELIAALSAVTAERDALLEGRVLDAETVSTLEQELRQSRDAYQHMIDQTMPLEPVPGDPRWSKRIELDDVIAERDQLRAEVEALRVDAERYRWLRGRLPGSAYRIAGVIYSDGGDGVDAAVDAAMAAKEA